MWNWNSYTCYWKTMEKIRINHTNVELKLQPQQGIRFGLKKGLIIPMWNWNLLLFLLLNIFQLLGLIIPMWNWNRIVCCFKVKSKFGINHTNVELKLFIKFGISKRKFWINHTNVELKYFMRLFTKSRKFRINHTNVELKCR